MKAAIYVRCSTSDQDAGMQTDELRAWAERLGLEVVRVYADQLSGTTHADERPALRNALTDAHERRYDVLLCWALDRVSRGGIGATSGILERLKRSGVGMKSFKEPWLDTSSPGIGELLTAVFAWCAAQERERIVERVRAGIARAKRRGTRSGKPIGRPKLDMDSERVRAAVARAGSIRKAAIVLGCDQRTLRNRLAN